MRPAASVLGVPGHLMVVLEILANGDQRCDAVADCRAELLGGPSPHVSGGEHTGDGRLEPALVVHESPSVEVNRAAEEGSVGIEPDEDECGAWGHHLLLARRPVPKPDGFEAALAGELDDLGVPMDD